MIVVNKGWIKENGNNMRIDSIYISLHVLGGVNLVLRYHGRWIDNVWNSCSYADALKENPINLYIFWKLNSCKIQPYLWNFLINADVPFCKTGHNLETEAKLYKAQHPFSNEVSLNVGADFHLIPSKDARKRTKNVHPCMQFYSIEKKTKNVSWYFYD